MEKGDGGITQKKVLIRFWKQRFFIIFNWLCLLTSFEQEMTLINMYFPVARFYMI